MPNLGIVMAEFRFRVRGVILEHDAGRRDRAEHFSIVFAFDRSKQRFQKRLDPADRSSGRGESVVQGFLSRFVHLWEAILPDNRVWKSMVVDEVE